MLEPLGTWKDTFDALPNVATRQGIINFVNWTDARVTNKMILNTGIMGTIQFTFDKGTYQSILETWTNYRDYRSGRIILANAWAAAVLSSTMSVGSGSYVGAPSPPTTWGPPPSTTVIGGSVSSAQQVLIEQLLALENTSGRSKIPDVLRQAFLMVTYMVTGINIAIPTPFTLTVPVATTQ